MQFFLFLQILLQKANRLPALVRHLETSAEAEERVQATKGATMKGLHAQVATLEGKTQGLEEDPFKQRALAEVDRITEEEARVVIEEEKITTKTV